MSRFRSTHCFRPTTHVSKALRGAKLFVCLFVVATGVVSAAYAQTEQTDVATASNTATEPRFYGGARVSFSVSDVSAIQEYDPRFGVGGGLFVAGRVWKNLDLRLEANYVQKGARLAFSRSSIEWQIDYLDIPLLLVVNLSPKSQTSVEFFGGVSYAMPMHRQIELGDNQGYDIEDMVDNELVINPTTSLMIEGVEDADLGLMLGVALSVPVGAVNFLVDARYTRSFTDPYVTGEFLVTSGEGATAVTTSTPADFSNRVFSFYAGFAFPFGYRAEQE